MSKDKKEDTWIVCPECKIKLKQVNLSTHMRHVHDKKIEDFDGSSVKVFPKKGHKQKKSMNISIVSIAVILIILVVIVGAAFLILSGSSDDSNTNGNGNSNNNSNNGSWLNDYTPVHSIGTGDNDFWINYPSMNPSSGQEVDHFNWIVDSLKSKPVLFVVHRTGCIGCADQAERVIQFGEKYTEEVKFYDLDAVSNAPEDITQKSNEVYMYDPNGSPGYIALTGVYTYIEDNDEVKIGWHTWEAPNDMKISNSDLETWIKDAIYYFNVNSGD